MWGGGARPRPTSPPLAADQCPAPTNAPHPHRYCTPSCTPTRQLQTAVGTIISGFCRDVFQELPLEFAAEVSALLSLKLEGSVG